MKDTVTSWILLTLIGVILFIDKANGIDLHQAIITGLIS